MAVNITDIDSAGVEGRISYIRVKIVIRVVVRNPNASGLGIHEQYVFAWRGVVSESWKEPIPEVVGGGRGIVLKTIRPHPVTVPVIRSSSHHVRIDMTGADHDVLILLAMKFVSISNVKVR